MSDLRAQFEAAAQAAQNLPTRPDNDTLLRIYALYKQATTGDATGARPGFTDFVGRAKYDAWAKLKGTDKDQAMRDYVALIQSLR
ncbi:MAG TPA: acyl-CoA-binding protein [Roseiflexaceae bacterium]|nr:acyl-CoA-binding protein [Roseiflexaceae bacterium]